jgi:hypothetical protein
VAQPFPCHFSGRLSRVHGETDILGQGLSDFDFAHGYALIKI